MAHLSNRTKFFIGTSTPAATVSQFEADSYVQIKDVHDLGEFGDLAEGVEYIALEDNRRRRLKGSVDGGTMDLIVNRKADDPGQIKLAEASKLGSGAYDDGHEGELNFKVVLPDAPTSTGTGSTLYFRAIVLGGRTSFGEADNVVRTTWTLAINTEWLEVEPDDGL